MKCKIWNTEKKAWEKGFDATPLAEVEALGEAASIFSIAPRKNQVICWWTGKLDKNKKEIYHGDICDFESEAWQIKGRFVVNWRPQTGSFRFTSIDGLKSLRLFATKKSVVVGNFYENPDLLK